MEEPLTSVYFGTVRDEYKIELSKEELKILQSKPLHFTSYKGEERHGDAYAFGQLFTEKYEPIGNKQEIPGYFEIKLTRGKKNEYKVTKKNYDDLLEEKRGYSWLNIQSFLKENPDIIWFTPSEYGYSVLIHRNEKGRLDGLLLEYSCFFVSDVDIHLETKIKSPYVSGRTKATARKNTSEKVYFRNFGYYLPRKKELVYEANYHISSDEDEPTELTGIEREDILEMISKDLGYNRLTDKKNGKKYEITGFNMKEPEKKPNFFVYMKISDDLSHQEMEEILEGISFEFTDGFGEDGYIITRDGTEFRIFVR